MKRDRNGRWHRNNGTWASNQEAKAYVAGVADGIKQGIAIGVNMAARALKWPLQSLWHLIRRRN